MFALHFINLFKMYAVGMNGIEYNEKTNNKND